MLPSSTVENYLKAIYQGQLQLTGGARLVPMGSVASALGVTPGTATTMVKALAESGLADYEPYSGVRLSAAGEKLAVLVLRRHRLVELFLVQFMGMSWAEVHDEAEQLEHVVSERLIERMDEMLGRPTHDPHGDPIPTPEGTLATHPLDSLMTCPLGMPLRVMRIADQDPAFLRFIESNALKPGEPITVESRNAAADAVTLRGRSNVSITIGTRAASKLLVELVGVLLAVLLCVSRASAQTPTADDPSRPWEIIDNSFLVEEAFNQDPGVVQNIFGWARDAGGEWAGTFTQEWPLFGKANQISYTLPFNGDGFQSVRLGNALINYRYQLLEEGPGRPAMSPRISVVLPAGSGDSAEDRPGLQVSLPFSKQVRDVYLHGNVAATWIQGVQLAGGARKDLTSPLVAGSVIWRMRPMLNLLLEAVFESDATLEQQERVGHQSRTTISPGFRRGWNIGAKQLVVGAALPVTIESDAADTGLFAYFSYELPFRKQP